VNWVKDLSHLSASAINSYNDCPMKCFIEFILRVRGAENIYSVRGKFFHSFMEILAHKYRANEHIDANQILRRVENKYEKEYPEIMRQLDKQELGELSISGQYSKEHEGEILGIEKQFRLLIDKYDDNALLVDKELVPRTCENIYVLKGVIDLIVKKNNKLHVIDWKTGRRKSANALKSDIQYKVYSIASMLMFPDETSSVMSFVYVSPNNYSPINLYNNIHDLASHVKSIRESCNRIEKDQFFTPNTSCYLCNKFCIGQKNCMKIYNMVRDQQPKKEIKKFAETLI